MRHAWIVLVILVGCSSPAAPSEAPSSPDLGAISGVVVSEGIVPIAEAQVQLSSGTEVTTDGEGAFSFENLEPGLYTLQVHAQGYLPIQSTTEVVAGSVAKPRVVLPVDTNPQPYHVSTAFDGYVEFADGWVTWLLMDFTGNTELCNCEFHFPVTSAADELIVEGFWEASNPANDPEFWWEVFDTQGNYTQGGYSASPLRHKQALDWEDGEGMIRFAVGTTVQVQQDFQAFATVFYNGAAPADWSIAT